MRPLAVLMLCACCAADDCGRPSARHPPAVRIRNGRVDGLRRRRIANSVQAEPHSFPWMVRIVTTGCGASVVGRRWVLTAAHCVVHLNTNNVLPSVTMNIGAHDLRNSGTSVTSGRIYIHGSYTRPCVGARGYDIALIRLPYSLTYSDKVRPICLPDSSDKFTYNDGTKILTAGWGNTQSGYQSNVLMMTLMHTTYTMCKKYWWGAVNMNTEFCAQGDGARGGTCRGDSGGPQFVLKGGRYTQVGATSCGPKRPCATRSKPSWYTHVPSYIGWIRRIMGGKVGSNCADADNRCGGWAARGECTKNPAYMRGSCAKSCGLCGGGNGNVKGNKCGDTKAKCGYWASIGECTKNPTYMHPYCAASCNRCGGKGNTCRDNNRQCRRWAAQGECSRNPRYMRQSCARSCRAC